MPHRRRIKKGSFGSHFDELVKHFSHDEPAPDPPKRDDNPDERHINDKLFENAWRKVRKSKQEPTIADHS